jgi:hypothetical protein
MISKGSKISTPKNGMVTLVSVQETPEGFWDVLVEGDDGSQSSELLSNEEMDAISLLDVQTVLKQELPAGQSDEEVLPVNEKTRMNRRLVIMSVFGIVVVAVALILVFLPRNGGSEKAIDEFSTTGQLDGRSVGKKSLGLNWNVLAGDWSIDSGKLSANQSEIRSFASISLQSLPKSFTVNWIDAIEGSGMVFLYEDDLNFWKLVALPSHGVWNLYKISDGVIEFMANSGPANMTDTKVEVLLSKDQLKVVIDEQEVVALRIAVDVTRSDVGLVWAGFPEEAPIRENKLIIESIVIGLD